MAYRPKRGSTNWADIPRNLVDLILDKLVFCFNVICKFWNISFTSNHYKEDGIRLTNNQLPWLLVSNGTDTNMLYNFTTGEISSFRLRVPIPIGINRRCHASSHGWLFFMESYALVVLNPLSGTIFHLPPLNNPKFDHLVMATFSRDPSLGSFEVLVSNQDVVAHLKYGDQFWSYSETFFLYFSNFTFYKNDIFSISEDGEILSLDITESSRCIKFKIIASTPKFEYFDDVTRYFVETTKGELVLVHRYCGKENEALTYKIYKLIYSHDLVEPLEVIPINNLDGDSIFLGDENHGISVSASNYPGCIPNSIYYGGSIDSDFKRKQFEVFNLEDGSILPYCLPGKYFKSCLASWIVPTIML